MFLFVFQVDPKYQEGPYKIQVNKNGLEKSQLVLKLPVSAIHFHQGDMKLKCLATISEVYKQSNERRVAGDDKILKQPMESRETRAQSHTRNNSTSTGIILYCLYFT